MIRVEENKHPQENSHTKKFYPKKIVIPLAQHTGSLPELTVAKKDSVSIGDLIAKSNSLISANIHSSVSGKILDIKEYNHPILKRSKAVLIECCHKFQWLWLGNKFFGFDSTTRHAYCSC